MDERLNIGNGEAIFGNRQVSNRGFSLSDFISLSSFRIPDWVQESAWIEHVPFVFWLVEILRPRMIVELGTENGVSYMAFCQAVCRSDLETKCFAIDTWKGDEQTGFYGEEVFETLSRAHQHKYSEFSRLIRSTFDEAAPHFETGSIDLLHIDGLHTYEAVKHDFESWFPKLSSRAVVLLHDTNVRERNFGVFNFWSELRSKWAAFEFFHGNGLGVLGVGPELASELKILFAATEVAALASQIRKIYSHLGSGLSYRQTLEKVQEALKVQGAQLNRELQGRATHISQLEATLSERTNNCAQLNKELQGRATHISQLEAALSERTTHISQLEATLSERTNNCEQLNKELRERTAHLSQLEAKLAKLQVETSERINDSELLRGKIDSMRSSICWRLTWPIRWCHMQLNWGRRTLLKAQPVLKTSEPSIDSPTLHDYFSETFYLSRNPELAATGIRPLRHYLEEGWKEGRSPHPLFDVRWYLEHNQDARAAGVEPLIHYLQYGWKEGRSPHPLFDVKWYLSRNPAVSASGIEPLKHYLDHGWKDRRDPHPLFSVSRYLEENPDARESGIEPLTHYVLFKVKDSRVIASKLVTDAIDSATLVRSRFPNLVPLRVFSASKNQRRVSLITDSISEGSLFGGVGTAIIFSVLLAESWNCPLRIITRTQHPEPGNVKDVLLANNIACKNIEFLFAHIDADQTHVDVSSEDVFVTTSWWTTWSTVQSVRSHRIIYLLQEDERMFYPEGDEKLRCQETMSNADIHILVNSYLLYQHLVDDGFGNIKQRALWFEPSILDNDGERLPATRDPKKWNFFFYARPVNFRNLFYLGLEVIEKALLDGILDAKDWNFFFAGKDLTRLALNGSIEPALIQNVKWSQYKKVVKSMDLGLSLMSTPHPSYPPLDLAASGCVVVTNTFGVKTNLEAYSANIVCGPPTIEGLTNALKKAMPLVYDPIRRQQNCATDQILRDWRTSFERALDHLSRELWGSR
jgi:hypothetical protein